MQWENFFKIYYIHFNILYYAFISINSLQQFIPTYECYLSNCERKLILFLSLNFEQFFLFWRYLQSTEQNKRKYSIFLYC